MSVTNLEQYRQTPRPSYYDANTNAFTGISLDMETWLLYNCTSLDKRTFVARLQKAVSNLGNVNGARDNLYQIALQNQATVAGAVVTELTASLSEFQSQNQSNVLVQANGIAEVAKMVADMAAGSSEKLAAMNQATNQLVSASVLYNGISTTNTKKQVQSWIEIVTSYIIE
jgi:hypothetical protein